MHGKQDNRQSWEELVPMSSLSRYLPKCPKIAAVCASMSNVVLETTCLPGPNEKVTLILASDVGCLL